MLTDTITQAIFEDRLIFEMPLAVETTKFEYQVLPMIASAPQTAFIGKTVTADDKPIQKFRRLIKQGYHFTNLIYAPRKVAAVFERQRTN